MPKIEFEGEIYNDDRMFLVSVCKCTIREEDDMIVTTIHHDNPPQNHEWCLVTFKNTKRCPAIRVDHFDNEHDTTEYRKKIEPETPLVSLSGHSPYPPTLYAKYVQWKKDNNLKEYNYKNYQMDGGHNYTENIYQRKR